jgi:serine/threonine-protein kinase
MSRKRDYQPGELVPGTIYQVHRVLGAGGMGTVYDVEDTTIGKRYVLKTLHPELGDRQDLARRMKAEARALARLHHPNIVDVVTAGVTGDDMRLPFYVMERLEGQSLRYVLQKKGALDLPLAYHIAIDLLDALDHAHSLGIVHRDVKPDNIFLHRQPNATTVTKLLDFGIMSVLDGGRGETGGRFLGTLRYASPEQLTGQKPSPKMDLYAAGLVLFEMLAGRGPFDEDDDPAKVGAAHVHREAPLISRFVEVPDALVAIVRATLAKDPARRPQDAHALAAQVRALKKALGPQRGEVSTEHRDTAAAVLIGLEPPSTPPMVHVQPGVAMGALSPLAMSQAVGSLPSIPKTTVRGMMPPTLSGGTLQDEPGTAGPTLASAGAAPNATPHMGQGAFVDRMAPTHSIALETPRMPHNGTDPLGATVPLNAMTAQQAQANAQAYLTPPQASHGPQDTARVTPSAPPPSATPPSAMPPIQWPVERPEARTESAHVQTLPVGTSGGKPIALIAVLSVLVVVAVVVSGLAILRVAGGRASNAAAAASATSSATVAASVTTTPTTDPTPVATMTASTAIASTDPTTSTTSTSPSATTAGARAKPGAIAVPTKPIGAPPATTAVVIAPPPATTPPPVAPPPQPKPPDRPGPGF